MFRVECSFFQVVVFGTNDFHRGRPASHPNKTRSIETNVCFGAGCSHPTGGSFPQLNQEKLESWLVLGVLPGWFVQRAPCVLPQKRHSKTGSAKCAKQCKTALLCRHECPNSSTPHLEKTKRMDILLQELARSTPPRRGAHKSYESNSFSQKIPLIPKNYDGFFGLGTIFGYDDHP